jgi:mRNA interferase RelE/StbE
LCKRDVRASVVTPDSGQAHRYGVVLAPGARRALTETLPVAAALAACEFITGPLRQRPRAVGASLRTPYEGLWRACRGEYRVRYRIDEASRQVLVLDIEHGRGAHRS